jgi:hypothetical protein
MTPAAVALGFRAHSGWTMLVAVSGPPADPSVVLRRRVELSRRTPPQPFHAAEGRPFAAAAELIRRATDEATQLAGRAVEDAIAELRSAGRETSRSGLLLAAGRPLPELRAILESHALIHAAEGELFRAAVRRACHDCGLHAVEVPDRQLEERAAAALRRPSAELAGQVAAWGKELGPPWRQDEKRAALVAWVATAAPVPIPGGAQGRRRR